MADDSSRNPSLPPLSESEIEKMQGDFIKDTVFSKRWVLDVLLKLYKHDESIYSCQESSNENQTDATSNSACDGDKALKKELEKEFENNLCQLWDMTANSEVALFLTEHDCKDALLHALQETQSPRLMEICFGIIGNLLCVKEILVSYSQSQEFRMKILGYITVTDALSLVELTRLLNTALSSSSTSNLWLLDLCDSENAFLEQLVYLLGNSLNTNLLAHVIEILDVVFDYEDECINRVVNDELLDNMMDGLNSVKEDGKFKCMVTLIHMMQVISTSNKGLETLKSNIKKFLDFLKLCIDIFAHRDTHETYSDENFLFYASMLSCITSVLPEHRVEVISMSKRRRSFFSVFINYLHNKLDEIHGSERETLPDIAYIVCCVKCLSQLLKTFLTGYSQTMKFLVSNQGTKLKIASITKFIAETKALAELQDVAKTIDGLF